MTRFTLFILLGFLSPNIFCQSSLLSEYGMYDSIPVIVASDSIHSAWSGGIHSPMFSSVDMNKDGKKDLVIFDRRDNSVNVFINSFFKGLKSYIHDAKYTQYFPEVDSWVLFYDYNNDSLPDLFTTHVGSIQVYKNVSIDPKKSLSWQLLYFRSPADSTKWEAGISHKSYYNATDYTWSSVACNNLSIPAFVDVEDDGDMDILVHESNSGTTTWYENKSIDFNGHADTLDFRKSKNCWGKYIENIGTGEVTLNASCKGSRAAGSRHAGGSTIYVTDINCDSLKDCFISGANIPTVNALYNNGSNSSVVMGSIDTTFHSPNKAVDINFMIRPIASEVTGDSLMDLIFAPVNYIFNKDHNQIWMYENKGTKTCPDYQYKDSSFLYDEVMDFGTNAHPLLFDLDGDSLNDLLVGNSEYFDGIHSNSKVAYYKNVGDNFLPEFKLITKDFRPLSAGDSLGNNITKGDLDNDGDFDILLTKNDGRYIWFENISNPGDSARFRKRSSTFDTLNFDNFSKPCIFDLNGDSLPDLLVGKQLPWISYYENIGSKTEPRFTKFPTNNKYGNIQILGKDPNKLQVSPVVIEIDSNGKSYTGPNKKRYIVAATSEGSIFSFLMSNSIGKPVDTSFTYNSNLSITMDIVNKDSIPVIICGTERGGLINLLRGKGFVPKPPPCNPSSELTVLEIWKDTAVASWNSGSGTSWDIGWAKGLNSTSPTDSVLGLTYITHVLRSLDPNQDYKVWIRDNCTADNSGWAISTTFKTLDKTAGKAEVLNDFDASIFPNPFNNELKIVLKKNVDYQIKVFDLNGKVLFQRQLKGKINSINTTSLNSGIYILELKGENFIKRIRVSKIP